MSEPQAAVTNTSLGGHLRLECSARPDGSSYISSQDFRVPVHIGKGHLSGRMLVLNIANPTAGFFDGDRVETDVTINPGARLCLTTPASARVYPTRSGRPAANLQRFEVMAGGILEWMPESFIPHRGASYLQRTEIRLHDGAGLLFAEWLAPGRVAMGEQFAYRKLRWELDLYQGTDLLARERYTLEPEDPNTIAALTRRFPAAHYLSIYAAGPFAQACTNATPETWLDPGAYIGHGPLNGPVHVIRALCIDSLAARRLLGRTRRALYQHAGLVAPALGRLGDPDAPFH